MQNERTISLRRLYWVGPLAVLSSIVAVLLMRLIAVAIVRPAPNFLPLTITPAIVDTTILVTWAVVAFAVVLRFASNPISTFKVIAGFVLLGSFLPDIALALSRALGATWPYAFALMSLHVAAWAACVSILTKLAPVAAYEDGKRPRWMTAVQSASDVLLWLLAFIAGVAVELLVIVRTIGLQTPVASLSGKPIVWIVQFLQPLITLPILTIVLRWRGEDWGRLGLHLPTDWRWFCRRLAVALLVMFGAAYVVRHGVIAPLHLQSTGASPFSGVQGNVSAFVAALTYAAFGAGLNEELQFRGFLQDRVTRILGSGTAAVHASVVVTALVFGLFHRSLGAANVVYASLLGIVLGELYLWADRNLWVVVIVHSLFDVVRVINFFLTGNDLPTG